MAAAGKAPGAVAATPAGSAEKHKKQHSNGKKLWKWMCTAAGAASKWLAEHQRADA
jgi:hypothetical protein